MYSEEKFSDTRKIQEFIKTNNLIEIQHGSLDGRLYPYYYDCTKYYRDDTGNTRVEKLWGHFIK